MKRNNRIKILVGMIIVFAELLVAKTTPVFAATRYDVAPKVLKGSWTSSHHKTSHYGHRNWFTILSVSNTVFSLRDFTHDGAGFTGEYGIHKGYWALGFQKASPRHYYVWGSDNQYGSHSKGEKQFGIVFTHSYKHFKMYSFKVTFEHGEPYYGNKHYAGYFHRGFGYW